MHSFSNLLPMESRCCSPRTLAASKMKAVVGSRWMRPAQFTWPATPHPSISRVQTRFKALSAAIAMQLSRSLIPRATSWCFPHFSAVRVRRARRDSRSMRRETFTSSVSRHPETSRQRMRFRLWMPGVKMSSLRNWMSVTSFRHRNSRWRRRASPL